LIGTEKKTREIDLRAHYVLQDKGGADHPVAELFYSITAEVKKTTAPWIAIRDGTDNSWTLLDAWNNLICIDGFSGSKTGVTRALSRSSLSHVLKWQARGLHESFKKPENTSRWYGSFVSACKAAEDDLSANTVAGGDSLYVYFAKPVVILDGQLVSARLTAQGITLEEIDAAAVRFEFGTEHYKRNAYSVDLVCLAALPRYIARAERRAKQIFAALVKANSQALGKDQSVREPSPVNDAKGHP
jgi:hypothetical protein